MLLAIISAVLAYRKANDAGRNGILWAFIAAATFIGTQFITYLFLAFGVGLYLGMTGGSETDFEKFDILFRIVAIVVSFVSTWLVLKFLDRVPEPDNFTAPPPPPDRF
jgi:hypothetical protein